MNNTKDIIKQAYVDLLIRQYRDKPNAIALTKLTVENETGEFAFMELQNFFDIDNASGKWLDKLGELFGAKRTDINAEGYEYADCTFALNDSEVFFANQNDVVVGWQDLDTISFTADNFYRIYIKLVIASSVSNHSIANLTDIYAQFFGNDIVLQSEGVIRPMAVLLQIVPEFINFVKLLYQQNKLPLPAGVGVRFIIKQPDGNYFSYHAINTQDLINGNIDLTNLKNNLIANAKDGYINVNDINTAKTKYITINDIFFIE